MQIRLTSLRAGALRSVLITRTSSLLWLPLTSRITLLEFRFWLISISFVCYPRPPTVTHSLSPIHPVSNHTYILLTALSPNPSPISIKASPFIWRVARYKCHHEFTCVTGWMFALPLFRFCLTANTLRLATTPEVGTVLIGL